MVFQESLFAIARRKDLTGTELFILLYLMAEADYENRLWGISSKMIQQALSLTQPQVSKGLGRLVELKILEKDEHGRLSISPDVYWRGKAATYKKAMKARAEAVARARDEADKATHRPEKPCDETCQVCHKKAA